MHHLIMWLAMNEATFQNTFRNRTRLCIRCRRVIDSRSFLMITK